MAKKKQIDKQFKIDAVNYRKNHPELTMACLLYTSRCV